MRAEFEAAGIMWDEAQREFRSPDGFAIQLLIAGDRAGKQSQVRLPDPTDPSIVVDREGLSVLSLSALVESKIAAGQGDVRRTHKDFADVVELISQHNLHRDFARHLHKDVRAAFRQLVGHAQGKS